MLKGTSDPKKINIWRLKSLTLLHVTEGVCLLKFMNRHMFSL